MHLRCSVAKQIDIIEPHFQAEGHVFSTRCFAGTAGLLYVKLQELSAVEGKINFRIKTKIPIVG